MAKWKNFFKCQKETREADTEIAIFLMYNTRFRVRFLGGRLIRWKVASCKCKLCMTLYAIHTYMFEQHFQILDSDVFVSTMVLVVWETVSYFHLGIIELLMWWLWWYVYFSYPQKQKQKKKFNMALCKKEHKIKYLLDNTFSLVS